MKRLLQKITIATTLLGSLVFNAFAQEYTLDKVLETARLNYPLLKAKQADAASAGKRVSLSRTDYLPVITAQGQYTYSSNNNLTGSFVPGEGLGLGTTGPPNTADNYDGVFGSLASVSVDWRIFNFCKVRAGVNVAQRNRDISQADYDNELFQHQVRVADVFLSAQLSRKMVIAQENNFSRASHLKSIGRAGSLSGIRPSVDSLLSNAEYAKASLALAESYRNDKIQRLKLAELIGTSGEISVDTSFYQQPLPSSIAAAATELSAHPRLRLQKSQLEATNSRISVVKRTYMPSLSLVATGLARGSGMSRTDGSYNYDFAAGTQFGMYNYLAGVALRWNLTGLARLRYDYGSEKAQADRFQYLYEEQELILKRQVSESEVQLQLAQKQLQVAPIQRAAAEKAYDQAESRYQNGLTDILILNQSYYVLNRAEVDYYIAVNNFWKSLLIRAAANGDLELFLKEIK